MRKPVFPERACRVMVWGEFQGSSCEVVEYHTGPCASESVPSSVGRREEWELANADAPVTAEPEIWA